jgi:tetratricopeptide (TPR) repeat protein
LGSRVFDLGVELLANQASEEAGETEGEEKESPDSENSKDHGFQIGDLIVDHWRVIDIIEGGMGIVYVAFDESVPVVAIVDSMESPGVVAVKTFRSGLFSRDRDIADRFKREALAWVNLDHHQNVTQAYYLKTIDDKPYLFLEYVAGGDLSSWINTPRLIEDIPQVLRFAIQFCDGMAHAASKGLRAHRDIKPQNCLITNAGTLKITDFGLAKVLGSIQMQDSVGQIKSDWEDNGRLTLTGVTAGTPGYMSPEQFDDWKHVDERADIYSFGIMLFEMITGRRPFAGRSLKDLRRLHRSEPIPPLDGADPELEAIVKNCLAKDPAERFPSFGVLRDELAKVYARLACEDAPHSAEGLELDALQLVNKAANLVNLGRLDEALTVYDCAIQVYPDSATAWLGKGIGCGASGEFEESLSCLDRAIEIDPELGLAWSEKALVLAQLDHFEEAITCGEKAIELSPKVDIVWWNVGRVYVQDFKFEKAVECLSRAVTLNPGQHRAWYHAGFAFMQLGMYEEATGCLNQYLSSQSKDEKAWTKLGESLLRLGRAEESITACLRATELNPGFALGWQNVGQAAFELNLMKEAYDSFDRAVELDPNLPISWYNKGVVLSNYHKDYPAALTCCEEALRLGYAEAAPIIEQLKHVITVNARQDDPIRLRRKLVENIYWGAIQLQEQEREDYLIEACEEDAALRTEVDEQLCSNVLLDNMLDRLGSSMSAQLENDADPDAPKEIRLDVSQLFGND